MFFLAIATLVELLCVILYAFVFPKLPIVKYYRAKAASEGSKTVSADLAAAGIQTQQVMQLPYNPPAFILLSNIPNFFNLILVFT